MGQVDDFLHSAQREWVERDYSGLARVSGSVGTSKTIVALHRAVYLVRANPDARVLLATFSDTLADALRNELYRLISHKPSLAERLEVHAMDAMARRLYEAHFGTLRVADAEAVRLLLASAGAQVATSFSAGFLFAEWRDVVDAWQLDSWTAYRDVRRLDRKTRLPEAQRELLRRVFVQVRA